MIEYTHTFSPADWLRLRKVVGWNALTMEQAERGIAKTAYKCAAVDNGRVVAMARFLFDDCYTGYISDVIVEPAYQGKGIGRHMMQEILAFIHDKMKNGEYAQITLSAALGKEAFYKKFGFIERPNETCGAGMMLRINAHNG